MPLLLNFLYVALSRVTSAIHLRKIPLYPSRNWNHLFTLSYDVELKYYLKLYNKDGHFMLPDGQDKKDFLVAYHKEVKEVKSEKRKMKTRLDFASGVGNCQRFEFQNFASLPVPSQKKGGEASKAAAFLRHQSALPRSLPIPYSDRLGAVITRWKPLRKPPPTKLSNPAVPLSPAILTSSLAGIQRNKGLVRLTNCGNTCFMNCSIQCLMAVQSVTSAVAKKEFFHDKEYNRLPFPTSTMVHHYIELVQRAQFPQPLEPPIFDTSGIVRLAQQLIDNEQQRHFPPNRMGDAHEFLQIVLFDKMGTELNQIAHSGVTLSHSAGGSANEVRGMLLGNVFSAEFTGVETSIVTCTLCKRKSTNDELFTMISLPLTNKTGMTCNDLFTNYTKTENLETEMLCAKCEYYTPSTKELRITMAPPVLVIHLKRFENSGAKNDALVVFPEILNISVLKKKNTDQEAGMQYRLVSTAQHSGDRNNGHYTANIKHQTGDWVSISDNHITARTHDFLPVDAEAYILFYERIEVSVIDHDPRLMSFYDEQAWQTIDDVWACSPTELKKVPPIVIDLSKDTTAASSFNRQEIDRLIQKHKGANIPTVDMQKTRPCLEGYFRSDAVLVTKFNIPMTQAKFLCLRPRTWLNDEVSSCLIIFAFIS